MITATSNNEQQVRIPIQVLTLQGNPAQLVEQPTLSLLEGDAEPAIENYDAAAGKFDIVLKSGAANTTNRFELRGKPDLDNSGDPDLVDEVVYPVTAAEAGSFTTAGFIVEPKP